MRLALDLLCITVYTTAKIKVCGPPVRVKPAKNIYMYRGLPLYFF